MPPVTSQSSCLEHEFLPIRAKILEIASALDRIERADENGAREPRWEQLQSGIALLQSASPERAKQVQLLFSCPYDEKWKKKLKMSH